MLSGERVFSAKKADHQSVPASQDALRIRHIHGAHGAEQRVLGQRHGRLRGAVHGNHPFINAPALPQNPQQVGRVFQIDRQVNSNPFFAQKPIGLTRQLDRRSGAGLQRGPHALRRLPVAQIVDGQRMRLLLRQQVDRGQQRCRPQIEL